MMELAVYQDEKLGKGGFASVYKVDSFIVSFIVIVYLLLVFFAVLLIISTQFIHE